MSQIPGTISARKPSATASPPSTATASVPGRRGSANRSARPPDGIPPSRASATALSDIAVTRSSVRKPISATMPCRQEHVRLLAAARRSSSTSSCSGATAQVTPAAMNCSGTITRRIAPMNASQWRKNRLDPALEDLPHPEWPQLPVHAALEASGSRDRVGPELGRPVERGDRARLADGVRAPEADAGARRAPRRRNPPARTRTGRAAATSITSVAVRAADLDPRLARVPRVRQERASRRRRSPRARPAATMSRPQSKRPSTPPANASVPGEAHVDAVAAVRTWRPATRSGSPASSRIALTQ